ncbi:hypothetical protein FKP32DRAFT_757943 [Trametes sanguinea]|nr:hypothetical protein FKP32DRAFT_757943 [Trametes sanguinea]
MAFVLLSYGAICAHGDHIKQCRNNGFREPDLIDCQGCSSLESFAPVIGLPLEHTRGGLYSLRHLQYLFLEPCECPAL